MTRRDPEPVHTAPRSPVRRIAGYYRREGIRALLERLAQEAVQRATDLADRGILPEALVRHLPGVIFGSIDSPTEGEVVTAPRLPIAGWAWSRRGIMTVDLYVDDDLVATATTGSHRPDVAALFPGREGAATSGFMWSVPIGTYRTGKHILRAVVRDKSGGRRTLRREFTRIASENVYHAYYERTLPGPAALAALARWAATSPEAPNLKLWVDATFTGDLAGTIRSILQQGYDQLEWAVVCPPARRSWVEEQLAVAGDMFSDARITIVDGLPSPGTVASEGRSEEPPQLHGFLHPGEVLGPGALLLLAFETARAPAEVVYADHDAVQPSGRHIDPRLKPDWSPDHLLSRDYVGGFYLVASGQRLAAAMRPLRARRGPGWRYELLLRLSDEPIAVRHVPHLLWSEPSAWLDAADVHVDGLAAVRRTIERRHLAAEVTASGKHGVFRVRWRQAEWPRVSIIIPTTGDIKCLRPCLDSLYGKTAYPHFDVLVIDNGRGHHRDGIAYARGRGARILVRDEPFNYAKLINDGVRATDGPVLLFLNDDVEIVQADWLGELVSQAMRPGVGAVGCLLRYPDGRVQHAGVVIVRHGGGVNLLRGVDDHQQEPHELLLVTREVSANTGACLAILRSRFQEISGFDEELGVIGNDVDLCLRLIEHGYRNLWTPHAQLIHRESVSRGPLPIAADEVRMRDRWATAAANGDPFYSPHLDAMRADGSLDWRRAGATPRAESDDRGVNLIGYVRAEMGLGEAMRANAYALEGADIPFTIIDHSVGNPARMADDSWLHRTGTTATYDMNLIHVNADLIGDAISRLPEGTLGDRYTIGYWAWELPEFPPDWDSAFDLVDEVWVPSAFVQRAVAERAPVPVHRIPHALKLPAGPFLTRDQMGLPRSDYQFLVMYDVHSVHERKNPEGAVHAFKRAFDARDGRVSMIIKVNGASAAERRVIDSWLEASPNIHVIDRILDRHSVNSLLASSDCLVSLHRSEGFGLALAEAMGLGKPVIATHWSGNVDFMNDQNAACIRYRLVTLDADHGRYRAGGTWADPDLDHAAWWMRQLREDRALGSRLGRSARQTVSAQLSPAAVGRAISQRLAEIRAGRLSGHRTDPTS